MKCPNCGRNKAHALGCPTLVEALAAQRDDLRADQVLRIAAAANMPIADVALCGPEFLALADDTIRHHAHLATRES